MLNQALSHNADRPVTTPALVFPPQRSHARPDCEERRLVGPTNFLAVVSGQWSGISTQRWKILCHLYPRSKPRANDRLTLSTDRYYYFPVDQLRRSTHCL